MSNLNQFANGSLLKYNTGYRLLADSTTTESNAFQSDTVAIMIQGQANSDTDQNEKFCFAIGSNPEANLNSPVGPNPEDGNDWLTLGVTAGHKISVRNAFDGGNIVVSVIELKY